MKSLFEGSKIMSVALDTNTEPPCKPPRLTVLHFVCVCMCAPVHSVFAAGSPGTGLTQSQQEILQSTYLQFRKVTYTDRQKKHMSIHYLINQGRRVWRL